jgi:hypothetical protein
MPDNAKKVVQSQPENASNKNFAIQNRVFAGIGVIRLPTPGFPESQLFVEPPRRCIRLPHFQKNSVTAGLPSLNQQSIHQLLPDSGPADLRSNDDVLEFPFRRRMPGNEKSGEGRRPICLRYKSQPCGRFRHGCEKINVLLLRPVGGRRGLPLEANHLSSILDCRLAYEIGQSVSRRVCLKLGTGSWFPKNLRVRTPHVVRLEMFGRDGFTSSEFVPTHTGDFGGSWPLHTIPNGVFLGGPQSLSKGIRNCTIGCRNPLQCARFNQRRERPYIEQRLCNAIE